MRSSAKTIVAALLVLLVGHAALAFGQAGPLGSDEARVRVEVNVVNLFVTVKDGSGPLVTDLGARDFEVFEDGKKQDLRYFARHTEVPLYLILLVDTSTSQDQVVAREKAIAAKFLERVLRPGDEAAIVTFDSNARVLQPYTGEVALLRRALSRVGRDNSFLPGVVAPSTTNGTRMCDAIAWAASLESVPRGDPSTLLRAGRKVLVVISDGVDFELDAKLKKALAAALRHDVMIYAVRTLDPRAYSNPGLIENGEKALRRLTEETGGRVYAGAHPDKLSAAFEHIAAEIHGQYSLGYTPQNLVRDGRFRRVKIKVTQKGARVQARSGYYAPVN